MGGCDGLGSTYGSRQDIVLSVAELVPQALELIPFFESSVREHRDT